MARRYEIIPRVTDGGVGPSNFVTADSMQYERGDAVFYSNLEGTPVVDGLGYKSRTVAIAPRESFSLVREAE